MQACAPISPPLRTRCIERTGAPLPPACRWRSYASATTGGLKSATGQPPSLTRRCCTPTRSGSPSPNELSPPRGIGVSRLALLRTLRGSRLGWGDRLAAPFRAHRPPSDQRRPHVGFSLAGAVERKPTVSKVSSWPRTKEREAAPPFRCETAFAWPWPPCAPRALCHQIVASRLCAVRGQATHPLAGLGSGGVIRHPCLQEEAPRWAHGDHEPWVPSPPSPQTWKFVHIPMSWTSRPRAFCKCPGPIAGRLNAPQVWRRSNFRPDPTGRPLHRKRSKQALW